VTINLSSGPTFNTLKKQTVRYKIEAEDNKFNSDKYKIRSQVIMCFYITLLRIEPAGLLYYLIEM